MIEFGDPPIDHIVQEAAEELAFIQERFFDLRTSDLVALAQRLADTFRNDGRLLVFGTGTSGVVAQALAGVLTHRPGINRPPLPALALNTDGALMGALAEHLAIENLFSQQIQALGRKGDLALAISWNGDSPAALGGLVQAREAGLTTAALLGRDGGKIKNYTAQALVVEAERPAPVHAVHLMAAHILVQLVERILFSL